MKYLLFITSIIFICLCFSNAQDDSWILPKDECPEWYEPCQPTITEVDCNISEDAKTLYTLMSYKNYTNVVNILVRRTNEQLQQIQKKFKFWTRPLRYIMQEQFPEGNLRNLILDLIQPLTEFIYHDLKNNLYESGAAGIDEEILDYIGTLSDKALRKIPTNIPDFGSLTKEFLEAIAQRKRPKDRKQIENLDEVVDWLKLSLITKEVDPSVLGNLILDHNDLNLRDIYHAYRKTTGGYLYEQPLIKQLKNLSEDYTDKALYYKAVVGMYKITKNRLEYFAERLHESLIKHNYNILNRIFITRREIDLGDIKNTYEKMYENSLGKMIMRKMKNKTTMDYKNALLLILEEKIA